MILAKQLAQSLGNFENSHEDLLKTLAYYKEKNLIVLIEHSKALNSATALFSDGSFMYLEFGEAKTRITAMPHEEKRKFLLDVVFKTYDEACLTDKNLPSLASIFESKGVIIPDELIEKQRLTS